MKLLQSFIIFTILSVCKSYRVLGVFPFNAKSHNIVFEALMKGLAKRGHTVDVITQFPLKKDVNNYKEILNLEGTLERLVDNYTMEFISQINEDVVEVIAESYGNRLCHFLGLDELQKLIKNPPTDPAYDVVITEAFGAHCFMGLGYIFNVPVVAVSSAIEYPWVSNFIGNDDNLAYVANAFHVDAGELNFWERVNNVISNYKACYKFHKVTGDSQTEIMRKYLRPDMPHIREVEKNVALTLVNSNPILFGVKPITPALIQIAGLHIDENDETLTPELKLWMDKSKHGVVYFSLGSMALIESFPEKQIKEIYASFKKIAPIKVLMKIANSSKLPPGLPENVKVLPWIPQIPLLSHPNIKLFINHGGLGGLQEALYYGVPMIGIPLFSDQFRNAESFVAKGMLIRIDYENLSEATLDLALDAALHNPSYKEKAVYYSKLFRDLPMSPMDTANFWIEYVIRNGGGVLKSPALSLPTWKLALLDVYGFIIVGIIFSFIAIILVTIQIFKKKEMPNISTLKKKKTRID